MGRSVKRVLNWSISPLFCTIVLLIVWLRASGAVVARPSPMREVRGSGPVRDKDFLVRMRRPNYLGLVTLTSFEWDDKPRSSVCTHSEHQARTIKILQSLCVSHKIVETYRSQHAPKFSKGKMEWCTNGSTDQSHLRMWHLLRTGQNIGQAPWAFDRMDMCAIKVFNQSINVKMWCTYI
jgi:hypothetical protein